MDFTAARQAEILAAISNVAALVADSAPVDDLQAQVAALTAERDAALAAQASLQARLDAIVADVQALSAADAQDQASVNLDFTRVTWAGNFGSGTRVESVMVGLPSWGIPR